MLFLRLPFKNKHLSDIKPHDIRKIKFDQSKSGLIVSDEAIEVLKKAIFI
jgi:hypothetical protein